MTSSPQITIGVPVFSGNEVVSDALTSIAHQTFQNFQVVVSVDGNDERSACVCRPFERDPRFRVVVQRDRLGWAGNINWLTRQAATPFFGYCGQDDRLDPTYYQSLIEAAAERPEAVVAYTDIQWFGARQRVQTEPYVVGNAFERTLAVIKEGVWFPFLGLRRTSVMEKTGDLLVDGADSVMEDVVWVIKALRFGPIVRVDRPLYFKRLHDGMVTRRKLAWSAEHKRQTWLDSWMRMLSAALPATRTPMEAEQLVLTILRRLATSAPDLDWFYMVGELSRDDRRTLITDFIALVLERDPTALPARFGADLTAIRHRIPEWTERVLGSWGLGDADGIPRGIDAPQRWFLTKDIAAGGWHALETDPIHGPFRWTGPGTVSDVPLNLLLDRQYRVRVHVLFAMPGVLPAGVELFDNGVPLGARTDRIDGGGHVVEALVGPLRFGADARVLGLAIHVSSTQAPADTGIGEDTRVLGCAVNWIDVEPV